MDYISRWLLNEACERHDWSISLKKKKKSQQTSKNYDNILNILYIKHSVIKNYDSCCHELSIGYTLPRDMMSLRENADDNDTWTNAMNVIDMIPVKCK